jgi:DNA-binding NarL/FixJ family response regulator
MPAGWTYAFWGQTGHAGCERLTAVLDRRQAVFDRTRIVIADDDREFAEMLQAALSLHEDFEVVAIAGDGAEAVAWATELRPQLVLMDVGMPKLDGIEATRLIRELSDPPLVILITGEDPRATGENAYDAGAAAYLLKSRDLPNLIDAILTCTRLSAVLPTVGAAPTTRVNRF